MRNTSSPLTSAGLHSVKGVNSRRRWRSRAVLIRSTRVEPSAICSAMPRPTAAGSFLKIDSSQPAKLHSGWPLPSENR